MLTRRSLFLCPRNAQMQGIGTTRLAVVIGVPTLIVLATWVLLEPLGLLAILLAVGVLGALLAFLIVESRRYTLGLFERSLTEVRSSYTQLEALQGLYWGLAPRSAFPPTRFWAASPDLLRVIASHVLRERPQVVVEASSGTSTVIIARCLQMNGSGKVVALEHDPLYAQRTRDVLAEHGLEEFAEVMHAPLVDHRIGDEEFPWYDTQALQGLGMIDLLVVDGPPDSIRSFARYPAVPLLRDRMTPGARVFLDDGARDDERVSAQRWASEFPGATLEFLPLEAGAWSLRLP